MGSYANAKLVHIESMHGIGDNLYQRPFVQKLAEDNIVYMQSSTPWMYSDIKNVKLIEPPETYRTQRKELAGIKQKWAEAPDPGRYHKKFNPFYRGEDLIQSTIIHSLEDSFDLRMDEYNMSLPAHIKKLDHGVDLPNKKIAIIRPATVRKEWRCETRNPDPKYINWCAYMLQRSGYYVISIADCAPGEEWIVGHEPPADLKLHKGELGIQKTLALLQHADIVVGGSGFIVPAAIAAGVPLFVIFGGRGSYDAPYKILDMRMNLKNVGWAVPDNHCLCTEIVHNCNKAIKNFDTQFFQFVARTQK